MILTPAQATIVGLAIALAIFGGIAIALIFVLERRKIVELRKLAFDVSRQANQEGLAWTDEFLESIATSDIAEGVKELIKLHGIVSKPDGMRTLLDPVFTTQLRLRLADPKRAQEIFDAVDAANKIAATSNAGSN